MQRDAPATLEDVARLQAVTEEFGIRSFGGGAQIMGAWARRSLIREGEHRGSRRAVEEPGREPPRLGLVH